MAKVSAPDKIGPVPIPSGTVIKDVTKGTYQVLPLSKVLPSEDNYRKTFDKKAQVELTQSIKEKGVLQPILVRPSPIGSGQGSNEYRVVAGHRRRQGAIDAGLKEIPAIIKDLSDEEALEIQVIENSHREDPNPMEEAWGFERLISMGKHTADTLAAKLDRSQAYVTGRLKLLKLPKEAQDKIVKGEISLGHALLLTRLRHSSEQKKLLEMITSCDGMTVKQAMEEMREFQKDIKNAVFDIEACKKCPYLSTNQAILFPELKKSGECMDRGCFFAKTRDHYKTIIGEMTAKGFKVIMKAEDLPRNVNKIAPPGVKDYRAENPKKYKSECMKCFENHVFFMYETEGYSGKGIESGEICLNKKCLDKMQGHQEGKDNSYRSNNNKYRLGEKARFCRDRFLRKTLPPLIEKSPVLQKRLLIYHLFDRFHFDNIKFVKEYTPDLKNAGYMRGDEIYRIAHDIPENRLDEALLKVLSSGLSETDPLVLLRMTEEAGIDMNRDFAIDKEFLNTRTKADIIEFAKKFSLNLAAISESSKKGELIEAILSHDLRGKLPEEVIEECKIEELNIEEANEDNLDRGDCPRITAEGVDSGLSPC